MRSDCFRHGLELQEMEGYADLSCSVHGRDRAHTDVTATDPENMGCRCSESFTEQEHMTSCNS